MASVKGSIHVLRFVNHAFCRILDKDQEALIGKPFAETVPVKYTLLSSLDRVFRAGQPESHAEQEAVKLIHSPCLLCFGRFWPGMGGHDPTHRSRRLP